VDGRGVSLILVVAAAPKAADVPGMLLYAALALTAATLHVRVDG
jgi:hypothetical protein